MTYYHTHMIHRHVFELRYLVLMIKHISYTGTLWVATLMQCRLLSVINNLLYFLIGQEGTIYSNGNKAMIQQVFSFLLTVFVKF